LFDLAIIVLTIGRVFSDQLVDKGSFTLLLDLY